MEHIFKHNVDMLRTLLYYLLHVVQLPTLYVVQLPTLYVVQLRTVRHPTHMPPSFELSVQHSVGNTLQEW